mmetsp:Transcript_10161/g.37816  ORF Transcript_10161/g.37816 Transcript_10161/m.37816 type:complete len:530 (-) Transcript_10161:2774-4363(-)
MGCHSSKLSNACISNDAVSQPPPITPKAKSTTKKSLFGKNTKRKVVPAPSSPGTGVASASGELHNNASIARNASTELDEHNITIQVQTSSNMTMDKGGKVPPREVELSAMPAASTATTAKYQSSLQTTGRDQNKKRISMPQVENHIKHIVRQAADDDYFDENPDDEESILHKHTSQNHSTSTTQNNQNVTQLDWNQVINEVMGSELPPMSKTMTGPHSSTKGVSNAAAGKLPHTDIYTRSAHSPTKSPNFASKEQDSLLLEDEFDFDSEAEDDINKRSLNLSGVLSSFKGNLPNSPGTWASNIQQVTVSLTCDLTNCAEKTDGINLPLPLNTEGQKFVRYHSFEPRPIYEEIRRVSTGYEVVYCQFEPDVTQVKYSVELELQLQDPAASSLLTAFYVGQKTPILLCNGKNEKIQDIVRQQKWMQVKSMEERIRSIAEFVGQLPYHLDLYDQIYYYLDSNQPNNKNGLNAVFSLLCEAVGIEGKVDHSHLTGYIFPNLRENIFVKMCFRELIKIEILNRSNDNDFERIYM